MHWILKGFLGTVVMVGFAFALIQWRYPDTTPEQDEVLSRKLGEFGATAMMASFAYAFVKRNAS